MVTLTQLLTRQYRGEFHYTGPSGSGRKASQPCTREVGPRGGMTEHVIRARVTGELKTWKRDPTRFRLPVKHGMYESGAITESNAHYWHFAEDCPLLKNAEATK